ncbi:MAG TPA: ABC transporter ATP-binding protein [Alphaproteobacteria bacterium]|nr:ABC transporter ATP-binding protein [Alphaproteobacteria bacterium]
MTEAILQTNGLSKRFGGLAAVEDVSLEFHPSRVHAVIGPNGAGKTTLINMLSGDLRPSAGSVSFAGSEIAGLTADRISRLGIGRSYQKTNIFKDFTVFENCRLAAQSRLPSSMRFFRPADAYRQLTDAARQALATVGLDGRRDVPAAALSHGEQRQLEIAMTLATTPKVLLLDEPLAGMGIEESSRMVDLLQQLARSHAIVLVEHDMDAVFAVADTLTVMVNGRVLESGTPEDIRSSAAVREAYLGTEDHHA